MNKLFVYGTLKSNHPANPLKNEMQQNLTFISEAYVYGKLYLVDNYPGYIKGGNQKVYGELYSIIHPEKIIPLLDTYEDYFPENISKSLYIRETALCYLKNSELEMNAFIYVYNKNVASLKHIRNGFF